MIEYIRLALSNLKQRGLRSFLTMLGVFIGIAAVVSLISLGQGLQDAITGQFSTLSADRLVVTNAGTAFGPPGSGSIAKLTDRDLKLVEDTPGVDRAIARLIRTARVDYNKIANFEYLTSLPNNQDDIKYIYNSFALKIDQGNLLELEDKGKVLVGSNFAKAEENGFEKDIRPGTRLKIQGQDFEVLGILKETSSFTFNDAIFILEEDMIEILKLDEEYDFIVAQVQDEKDIEQVADSISKKFRSDRNLKVGEEDFSIETPVQTLGAINTILTIINVIVTGIAAISLLVGGIGIANTMFTSVLERTREIGTMKALGAKNKTVLTIFLAESAFLGLLGGIVGVLLGLGLAYLVSFGANTAFNSEIISVTISWPLLAGAVLFSTGIGILSGTIPAFQASKLKPVEALRA